jgi:hypothetical protein
MCYGDLMRGHAETPPDRPRQDGTAACAPRTLDRVARLVALLLLGAGLAACGPCGPSFNTGGSVCHNDRAPQ